MADVSQGEFGRAVRGALVIPGQPLPVDLFVAGMSSSAHAAVRDVHRLPSGRARAIFMGKLAHFFLQGGSAAATARAYRDCLDRYISWDGHGAPAAALWTKGMDIQFAPGDIVRARPDVVLDDGTGQYEARVLLWDDLPLDQRQAEMIALPVVERVEAEFGSGSTAFVSVWQLETGQQEQVSPSAAQAQRPQVASLVASI